MSENEANVEVAEPPVAEFVWGEGCLVYPHEEKLFRKGRYHLFNCLLDHQLVRLTIPPEAAVTPQMIALFVEMGQKARRLSTQLTVRAQAGIIETLGKVPGATVLVLEQL